MKIKKPRPILGCRAAPYKCMRRGTMNQTNNSFFPYFYRLCDDENLTCPLCVVIIFILFSFIATPRRRIYMECGGRHKVQVIVVVVIVLCYGCIDRRQKTKRSRLRRSQTRRKCSTKTMAKNGRPMKYDRP